MLARGSHPDEGPCAFTMFSLALYHSGDYEIERECTFL